MADTGVSAPGADTAAVLEELGFDPGAVNAMREKGVLGPTA